MNNFTRISLGIKDLRLDFDPKFYDSPIYNGVYHHHKVHIIRLIQTYTCYCPICKSRMLRNGFKLVKATALPSAGIANVLFIRKQKFICPKSDKCPNVVTKLAQVDDIQFNHQITKAVMLNTISKLFENVSQTEIARQHAVCAMSVMRFARSTTTYIHSNYHWLPKNIAFDDFKSGNFAKSKMSMLLMDSANHRVLDIIRSRTNRFLKSYFLQYDLKARAIVKTVTVDLYSPYRKLIEELFPNAIIIADRFHVVTQAYQALNKVRITTMKESGKDSHNSRALKRYWKLLLKDSDKVDYLHYSKRNNFKNAQLCDQDVVDRLLAMSDKLKKAYGYYQKLLGAVHQRNASLLKELTASAAGMPEPIKKANRTLKKHRAEIINSFIFPYSNGPVEGTNNKIKAIKKTAYGFRNFDNFRLRILLAVKNSFLSLNYKNQLQKAAHSN